MPLEILLPGALLCVLLGVVIGRANRLGRSTRRQDVAAVGDPRIVEAHAARERAEERSRYIGDDLLQVADLVNVGVVRLDDALLVLIANGTAHGYLGWRPGSLTGRSAMEAFGDHRIEATLNTARDVGSAHGELVVQGGAQPTLLVRAQRARSGGIWLVMEDVSELRRLQRIRAEFIDNISHELRTPLTTVRLLTETLARDLEHAPVPDPIRDRVAKIDVETEHLVQMVNELLDLSRIEGGSRQLQLDDVDLDVVIRATIDRLRLFADRQGVRLHAELPNHPLRVRGDEERIGQLLVNLLHNAVKFSPGGGDVTVRARLAGEDAVVDVEDRGIGIAHEDLRRVFERFYKADRARVRGKGGTGLGLAIARHIVESHGGRIWVESEEGRGSTFSFAIPALEAI